MYLTFMIGNGFDRAIGLKTGYSEFYEWYGTQSKNGLKPHVLKFREEIDKYVCKDKEAKAYWGDAEIGLGQYTQNFSIKNIEQYMDCYEDFRDNLISYLTKEDNKLSLQHAQEIAKYFAFQIPKFLDAIDPAESTIVSGVIHGAKCKVIPVNILCFNYTNTCDKIFADFSDKMGMLHDFKGNQYQFCINSLIHVHGHTLNWPILGVCEPREINKKTLLKNDIFKSMLIKKNAIESAGQTWRKKTEYLIQSSTIICIFGMSLGISDSDYWHMIMEWLANSSERHVVIFWYNSNLKNVNISIREKVSEKQRIFSILRKYYASSDESFNMIKNRIHIAINSFMFTIPEDVKVKDT